MVINYNLKFNEILNSIDKNYKPNLFLHVCCGPCCSGIIYKLIHYFNIYIIFYNSNIDTFLEYNLRLFELKKLINDKNIILKIIYSDYNHNEFLDVVCGYESEPEGGKRCNKCFELRLNRTFQIAIKYIKENNLVNKENYMCTTLSISPHKDANLIMQIGERICEGSIIKYLPSDFKKDDGYLNSIKNSKELGLYRQNYCGCEFAK